MMSLVLLSERYLPEVLGVSWGPAYHKSQRSEHVKGRSLMARVVSNQYSTGAYGVWMDMTTDQPIM
jgi:hypothetical protein